MVKEDMMRGMGYVDRDEDRDETYLLEKDNLYLVGTAEQSVGPMFADEIIEAEKLPLRFIAFSTCFRREAGSYGKDTRGILRVHQFDKVEMFSFCHPDRSKEEHKLLLALEERMMQALAYRIMCLISVRRISVCLRRRSLMLKRGCPGKTMGRANIAKRTPHPIPLIFRRVG